MNQYFRNKKVKSGVTLAFLILLGTGCSSIDTQPQQSGVLYDPSPAEIKPSSNQYASRDGFEQKGELDFLAVDTYSDGFPSQDGFYRFVPRAEGGENLRYIDYDTAQEVYLCSSPNCDHSDENCTSWFPNFLGRQMVIPVGQHLVILHGNASGMGSIVADQILPNVELSELDGSSRTQVATFPASSDICSLVYDSCARDEQNLYFTLQTQNETGVERNLLALNVNTGDLFSLCGLPEIEQRIKGTYGNELIMTYVPYAYDFSADMQQLPLKIARYNPATNEFIELCEIPYTEIGGCYEGKYYTLTDDKKLCVYDLNDGSLLQEIQTSLPDNFPTSYTYRFDGIYDGMFYTHSYIDQGNTAPILMYYSISLDTGEATELTSRYGLEKGRPNPCTIADVQGENYLIIKDMNSVDCAYKIDDKHESLWPFDIPQYALIQKSDYWANIGQYEPIDNNL